MKLRIQYSRTQLEECVKFISSHNSSFYGQDNHIRQSIRSNMFDLAQKFPHCTYLATMGYCIECFIEAEEGMEEDTNLLQFEFYVDPSVSLEYDSVSEDIIITPEE